MDLKESKVNTGDRHPWEECRFLISRKLLKDSGVTLKSFIDLGSGDLFFSKELCKADLKCKGYAVDTAFSDEMVQKENADTSTNLKVFISLDKLQEEIKESVSTVFLMDVLEHIEDDKAFLDDLLARPFISNETVFFVTVPAFQKLFCSHDVFLEHFRRYNNKQLRSLLSEAGLAINEIGYFYLSLIFQRVFKVGFEKLSKGRNVQYSELNHWNHGKLITKLVKIVLITDFYFAYLLKRVGVKLPGLSNYAICRSSV